MSIEEAQHYARAMVQISNAKVLEDFVINVDLVMEGLRSAYFFDSTVITIQKARDIICCIYTYFETIRKVVIITLPDDTGDGKPDQYAVVNPKRLMDSYHMLQSSEWSSSFVPLSICSIAPFRCTDAMLQEIQMELIDILAPLYHQCTTCNVAPYHLHFDPIASDIRVIVIHNNRDVVGNIFLEGFLEDYVCIYHRPAPPPTPDLSSSFGLPPRLPLSAVPHCLHLAPLKRVTLTAVCKHNRLDTDVTTISTVGADEHTYLVTVCEFTIPRTYLDCSDDNIFIFNDMMTKKLMDLKKYTSSSHLVINVLLSQDEYILDSFNLSADAQVL